MNPTQKANIQTLADIAAKEGRSAAERHRREEWEFHRGAMSTLQQFAELEEDKELAEELWKKVLKLDRDWLLIVEEFA